MDKEKLRKELYEKVNAWFEEKPQRAIAEFMVDTMLPYLGAEWVSVDVLPVPKTPFGWYMVWLKSVDGKIEHGIPDFLQFSRDEKRWIYRPDNIEFLVVTHWAENPNSPPSPKVGMEKEVM